MNHFLFKEYDPAVEEQMELLEELENEKRRSAYPRQLDEIADGLVGRDAPHRFRGKE